MAETSAGPAADKLTFQDIIMNLQHYWAKQGCVVMQPYDSEVGAGTFHTATTLRARSVEDKGAVVAAVRENVWPMVADGRVRLVCEHRLPLAEADAAHALMREGTPFGKVVLEA